MEEGRRMRDAQWQNLTKSQLTLCSRVHGGCSKCGKGKEVEGASGGLWEEGVLQFLSPVESGLKALKRRARKLRSSQVRQQCL